MPTKIKSFIEITKFITEKLTALNDFSKKRLLY